MKTAIIALTSNGSRLALRLGPQINAEVFIKQDFITTLNTNWNKVYPIRNTLSLMVEEFFNKYEKIVFIMALGIVVRTIAPLIKSKMSDPAVIVMDEKGKYVISVLSGHVGGANKASKEIAKIIGGIPVITTSTDVNNVISFDVFAAENNCQIENLGNLKYISAELVNGGKITLYSDCKINGSVPDNIDLISTFSNDNLFRHLVVLSNRTVITPKAGKVLYVRPKNLVLGIGCKRNTSKEQIKIAIIDLMNKNNKSLKSIKCLVTIDLKNDEQGLLEFCNEMNIELKIIPLQDIKNIEENYTCSDFVKGKVGVASVAEPCSVLGSINGRLICKKTIYQGITLALSEEESEYNL